MEITASFSKKNGTYSGSLFLRHKTDMVFRKRSTGARIGENRQSSFWHNRQLAFMASHRRQDTRHRLHQRLQDSSFKPQDTPMGYGPSENLKGSFLNSA